MRAMKCGRGHAMTGRNVRIQINTYRPKKGTPRQRQARVCVACIAYRNNRKAAGKPIKDLRRGKRA